MSNNYLSPEKISSSVHLWEFAKYRHKGSLDHLVSMNITCGGPILVMDPYDYGLYIVTIPKWSLVGQSDGDHIMYPVGSKNPMEVISIRNVHTDGFILVGISHRGFKVRDMFNGMIPTPEDTSHIVFRPRAVDGKIVTEAGREMEPDELLFLDVTYPEYLIETVKNFDKILDQK